MARVKDHFTCGHCGADLGTRELPQCPHCHVVFNDKRLSSMLVENEASDNERPVSKTIIVAVGVGGCALTSAITLSVSSAEWSAFFLSIATSIVWQFSVTVIVLSLFISVLRALFSEKIDSLMMMHSNTTVYKKYLSSKLLASSLLQHRRIIIIVFLLIASVITLSFMAWKSNLDAYEIIINLLINLIVGLALLLIGDLLLPKGEMN